MNTSEQIDAIAGALSAAQAELVNPEKTKTANAGTYNYKYADLADTLDVVRKTLSAHKLSVVQATQMDGDSMILITRIMHDSGQWLEGVYPVCRPGAHQQMGSALTYARRYSLFAMVGIAGEDDTDGQGAAEATGARRGNGVQQKPAPAPQELAPPDLETFMLNSISSMTDTAKIDDWAKRHAPAFKRLSSDAQERVKQAADKRRAMLSDGVIDEPNLLAAG